MPDTGPPGLPASIGELLMKCSLTIAAFRRLNNAAGYAFREPPDVSNVLAEIDRVMFPDAKAGRKPKSARTDATSAAS